MGRKKGISYAQIRAMAGSWYAKNPDLTLKEIGEMTGVSEQTLVTWSREDKWKDEREFFQSTPIAIERALLDELKHLSQQGNKPRIAADAISKVKNALALIQRDVNPHITYSVLEKLDKFIAEEFPDALENRLEIHKAFLRSMIEAYNDRNSSKVIFING